MLKFGQTHGSAPTWLESFLEARFREDGNPPCPLYKRGNEWNDDGEIATPPLAGSQ
jgi:hypothetical protein